LLYGAGESIYDLFAGIVELVKMVWDVGKSLLTGNIIQDAKELWENIKKLDLSAMATDFLNKWNEVKSGPLKLTPFIEKQILKDMQLIKVRGLKVEWHLLAGGDPTALAALRKAGIDVIIY